MRDYVSRNPRCIDFHFVIATPHNRLLPSSDVILLLLLLLFPSTKKSPNGPTNESKLLWLVCRDLQVGSKACDPMVFFVLLFCSPPPILSSLAAVFAHFIGDARALWFSRSLCVSYLCRVVSTGAVVGHCHASLTCTTRVHQVTMFHAHWIMICCRRK